LPKVRLPGVRVTPETVPVPLRATVCGLPVASSTTESDALRAPAAVGPKVTEIVQLAPAASVLGARGHAFVWEKSPAFVPSMPTDVIVKAAIPEFVSVTSCGELEVPTGCWPKLRLDGESVTAGAAATPVPLSATECGAPGASSAMLILAARPPLVVGAKVAEIVQLAPTASVLGASGQVFVCAKSPAFGPETPIELIVSGAVPELVRVTF
jgi:hypothetical protein